MREDNRRLAGMNNGREITKGTLENAEEAIRKMKEEIQARY